MPENRDTNDYVFSTDDYNKKRVANGEKPYPIKQVVFHTDDEKRASSLFEALLDNFNSWSRIN